MKGFFFYFPYDDCFTQPAYKWLSAQGRSEAAYPKRFTFNIACVNQEKIVRAYM